MTTIVVVDDEYLITDFLSFFLREAGYSVHVARDGKAGLDVIATVAPDIVITDFMMPAMSGLELALALKADEALAHIPIILASAAQGATAREHSQLFAAVLDKPYPPSVLLDAIAGALEGPSNPETG